MADLLALARSGEVVDAIELTGPFEEDYARSYALYWLKGRASAPSTTHHSYRVVPIERRREIQKAIQAEVRRHHDWPRRGKGRKVAAMAEGQPLSMMQAMMPKAVIHVGECSETEKWLLLVGSLMGAMAFTEVVRWCGRFDSLDAALLASLRYRDGMVAT